MAQGFIAYISSILANSAQKDFIWGSNQEPPSCEATLQSTTTVPLFSPSYFMTLGFFNLWFIEIDYSELKRLKKRKIKHTVKEEN